MALYKAVIKSKLCMFNPKQIVALTEKCWYHNLVWTVDHYQGRKTLLELKGELQDIYDFIKDNDMVEDTLIIFELHA